jgi:hypothetical protein
MSTGALIGGIASLAGSGIQAFTGSQAANSQMDAANKAGNFDISQGNAANAYQNNILSGDQKNLAPWLSGGQQAAGQLSSLLAPGGGLSQGWNQQFQAPTNVTETNDPGYQFRLSQGLDALQNSAAARGGLLSGGTAKAIDQYAQNDASNEYGNVYNRALGQYQQQYNQFETNQSNQYGRLMGLAGMGQQAAGQLGTFGADAAGNVARTNMATAGLASGAFQNVGQAQANNYNAIGNGITGGLNNIGGLAQMNSFMGGGGMSSYGGGNGNIQNLLNNSSYVGVGNFPGGVG